MTEQDVKSEPVVRADDLSLDGVVMDHVSPEYQGTNDDKLDMKVLGRAQETRRMFTAITMLG